MNEATSKLHDPDLIQAGAALQRASRKAQELAQRTATPCYVWQDGKIVNIGTAALVVAPDPVA
jgi:hypothetical protein